MLPVRRIAEINTTPKPLACSCIDVRGKTRNKCPDCGGKGGMKGCPSCLGTGMSPQNGVVASVPSAADEGYLFHEFSVSMRALVAQRRRERAQAATAQTSWPDAVVLAIHGANHRLCGSRG